MFLQPFRFFSVLKTYCSLSSKGGQCYSSFKHKENSANTCAKYDQYKYICPMDCGWLGSSAHGIFQARMLEWLLFPVRRDLPDPGIKLVSLASPALAGRFFTNSATWEARICHQPPAYLSLYFSFPLGYYLAIFLFILVLRSSFIHEGFSYYSLQAEILIPLPILVIFAQ